LTISTRTSRISVVEIINVIFFNNNRVKIDRHCTKLKLRRSLMKISLPYVPDAMLSKMTRWFARRRMKLNLQSFIPMALVTCMSHIILFFAATATMKCVNLPVATFHAARFLRQFLQRRCVAWSP
jgi:hypothetical protein